MDLIRLQPTRRHKTREETHPASLKPDANVGQKKTPAGARLTGAKLGTHGGPWGVAALDGLIGVHGCYDPVTASRQPTTKNTRPRIRSGDVGSPIPMLLFGQLILELHRTHRLVLVVQKLAVERRLPLIPSNLPVLPVILFVSLVPLMLKPRRHSWWLFCHHRRLPERVRPAMYRHRLPCRRVGANSRPYIKGPLPAS